MAKKGKQIKEEIEEEKVKLITKADVYDKNGNFVRAYDEEIHGKDFKKLADEYAKKISGKVK